MGSSGSAVLRLIGRDVRRTVKVGDTAETEIAGRALGSVGRAGCHTVPVAVRLVAQIRPAAHRSCLLPFVEPVGAPLPGVAYDVVQAVAVGRERVHWGQCRRIRPRRYCASEIGRARYCNGIRHPAPVRPPMGSGLGPGRRGRRTPTPPRSGDAGRPSDRKPSRRARSHGRRDGQRDRRRSCPALPGAPSWHPARRTTRASPQGERRTDAGARRQSGRTHSSSRTFRSR